MKKIVDMLVGKDNFINKFTRCVHKWWKSRSVRDTWTHFPSSWCSVKFIFLFNIVHLLSCYFTHHIFWIGSPKREKEKHVITTVDFAMCNHVLCDPHSVLAWWLVGQLFETKSKDSRIDPLSVLTFKLFNLFSWFQDWCLFTLFSYLVFYIKFDIWVQIYIYIYIYLVIRFCSELFIFLLFWLILEVLLFWFDDGGIDLVFGCFVFLGFVLLCLCCFCFSTSKILVKYLLNTSEKFCSKTRTIF